MSKKNNYDSLIKELIGNDDDFKVGSDIRTNDWVDTGVYSLNYNLSGDIEKGLPEGKMIVVAGEPQSGKSFLGGRIAANALKKGYIPVWLDSEFAVDVEFFKRMGLDPDKVIYKGISSSKDLQIYTIKLLKKAYEKGLKLFIVMDSIGNLAGNKEASDLEADKQTADMGNRAKSIRTSIRMILPWIDKTRSIFYVVNHLYISPGFIPKKEMGGGMAIHYLAQIVVYLTRKKGEEGKFVIVKSKTKKNREFLEGRECQFRIDFRKGLDPYDGIIDLLKEFNILKDKKGWVVYNEKSYREKQLLENKELMNELIDKLV